MDGLLGAFKRLVGAQDQPARVVDQRVARNAGALVISTAEAAVNDDEPPAALDGAFAFDGSDRHMAVDDMAARTRKAELPQNALGRVQRGDMLIVGILDLPVGGRVGNVEPFKGRHGAAAEKRRFGTAPQIPQKVLPGQPRRAARRCAVALPGTAVAVVKQLLAAARHPFKPDGGKGTVLGHRHGTVVEQVAVADLVKRAVRVEELHMALQTLALGKAAHQPGNDMPLLGGEGGRRGGVHSREVAVQQGIDGAVVVHRACRKVDMVQKVSALQIEIRVAGNDLRLKLEHHHGHGLVHPGGGGQITGRRARVGVGDPARHIGVGVGVLGKALELAQADAVAALQRVKVVIGQRCFQHRHNAQRAAGSGTHPDNIMVAPLDVHLMVRHQAVENTVGARAAVKQITHDMQPVNGQPLDDLTEPHNVGVSAVIAQDALDDLTVVLVLVVVLKMGVEQFVQNVAAVLGQAAAHMVAGVLAGNKPAQVDQPQQRQAVPCVQIGLARLQFRQLLIGIVDQRCQLGALLGGDIRPQHSVDLLMDNARCAVQDMYKRLMLAVQITHKMLGALGQAQQRLNADDLAGGCGHRLVFLGKQAQIAQMFIRILHGQAPSCTFGSYLWIIAHFSPKQKAAVPKRQRPRRVIKKTA